MNLYEPLIRFLTILCPSCCSERHFMCDLEIHRTLTGICSLRSHIPCRLRGGNVQKGRLDTSHSHRDFVAFAPTSPAACGGAGLIKTKTDAKSKLSRLFLLLLAVRGGFEPPVRLPVRQFSKLVVSATHPSHQNCPFFLNGTANI